MKKIAARSSPLIAKLRIVVESPLVGVNYGVQEGKGSAYKVVQLQTSTDQDLVFEIQLPVTLNADGLPNFGGPLSQGPTAARFVYLNIGKSRLVNQSTAWRASILWQWLPLSRQFGLIKFS